MMKIIDIIIKEISLVKAQKIALLLIFLYPFLAIGLLGSSFTGIDMSRAQSVSVGVVNELDFESSLMENIVGYEGLNLNEYETEENLVNGLKNKDILVGLKLSGEGEDSQVRVDLFYDNSNLLSSRFFMEIAKALVQRVTIEMTQERLGEIWGTISDLGNNLEAEKNQVNEFKQQLDDAENSLNSLEAKLNSLDVEEIEGILNEQETSVNSYEQKANEFKTELEEFKVSFNNLKSELEDVSDKAETYEETILLILSQLDTQINSIDSQLVVLNQASQSASGEQKELIDSQIEQLTTLKTNMQSWESDLSEINDLILEISDERSNLNTTIDNADALFERLDSESNNVSTLLDSSKNSLNTVNSELVVFKESLEEVRTLISEGRKSKAEIEEKLDSSSAALSTFSDQIIEFSNVDPRVLAQPVVFYERKVFDVDPFGILVANAASIVLILTCMLLTSIIVILERVQNVALRFRLSPTNKFTFYIGKIIGQLLIALVEAMIIFLVAYIGFGIDTISILPQLLIAITLISISFISLGLIIATFMKNQSTAILTSLLLIVPMLFLSGVILPIEFMEPLMQQISYLLPLTVSNTILVGLIIKGLGFMNLIPEILIMLFIFIVILTIVLIKKDF
jgi:ABC-type multidrug transport system permease subunit